MTNEAERKLKYRRFQRMLRKAGYSYMHHGAYYHTATGYVFYCWNKDDGLNENWVQWYERGETPPPF